MRYRIGFLTIFVLAGCSGSPPNPPTFQGEYRPVNRPVVVKEPARIGPVVPAVFNFSFEGDIVAALTALHAVQPQLNVMPALGLVSPLPVRVTLRDASLEDALRAIGEQGRDVADVVWNTTMKHQAESQVFIRFRTPYKRAGDEPMKGVFTVQPEERPAVPN